MKKLKENALAISWALKLCYRINAKILIGWGLFSILLAILPAVALHYNREAVAVLSNFLSRGYGTFNDVVPAIIALGIILTAIGLSKRVNGDLLYFVMYDAYYFGFEEYMMDAVQRIEIKTLMDNQYRDEHYSSIRRGGSLTEFISASCVLIAKIVGTVSLLVVAATVSFLVFGITIAYIILVLFMNIYTANKWRVNNPEHDAARRRADHFQNSVMLPGVARELRVYNLGSETISKWEESYDKANVFNKKNAIAREVTGFISSIGYYIFIAGVMAYCIYRVADGDMTVDVFLMLYALGQNISDSTRVLTSGFQSAESALFALKRQRKFFTSIPMEIKDWQEGFEPFDKNVVFKADDISFSYDGNRDVLNGVSFEIKQGETIALVGVNGSGKTTLVKLLIGLFSVTKGRLKFYGKPYDPHTRGAVIKKVGMFFQDFFIFHSTLRENVGFGDLKNLSRDEHIHSAMKKGGANKLIEKLPNRLEQWLERNVKKDGAILSGGEKQRVAVSRTHMSDKEILIFDEPAAALDPIAEMEQFHAIREKIQGRTAILISHRVGFARLADRIIVLDGGKLVENGTHDDLMAFNGFYAGFFKEQAQWYEPELEGAQN